MQKSNSQSDESDNGLSSNRNYFVNEENKQKLNSDSEHFEEMLKNTYDKRFSVESSFDQSNESESDDEDEAGTAFFVPKILLDIWKQTSDYSKLYYLWVESFTVKQKIALWNSLEISFEFFKN